MKNEKKGNMLSDFERIDSSTISDLSAILTRIRYHLRLANTLMNSWPLIRLDPSSAAIHIRITIEYMMQLSLAGNQVELRNANAQLKSNTSLSKLAMKLKAVNEEFWPVPIQVSKKQGTGGINHIQMATPEAHKTWNTFIKDSGKLSEFLHAGTLMRDMNIHEKLDELVDIHKSLESLAVHAGIQLTQSTEWLLWSYNDKGGSLTALKLDGPLADPSVDTTGEPYTGRSTVLAIEHFKMPKTEYE